MIKKISELTVIDKGIYLENVKKVMETEQGSSWSEIEAKILADIDATFSDEGYARMKKENPEFAVDAKYAREHFNWAKEHKKPSLVDYMLWMGRFVTKSDWVEI